MILVVDNYDSFTFNLVQQFKDQPIIVLRNDDPTLFEVAKEARGIVLSAGPGHPAEAGFLKAIIERFYQTTPILGFCLGHQAIGEVFGGTITKAANIMHGKQSLVTYRPMGVFQALEGELQVMRYHSLVIDPKTSPHEVLEQVAETPDAIMAIQHKEFPVFGLQFHPESLGTPKGQAFIQRFIEIVEESQ